MSTNNLIKSILRLPEKFYALGNVSIYNLLKDTGYFEVYNQINETVILDELKNDSECINHWLNWSDHKQTTSGWYFKKDENGEYVVNYFPSKENSTVLKYSNSKEACAAFIKREIEEIRKS